MIPRYAHPEVDRLWSPTGTYTQWLAIETETMIHQRALGILPLEPTADFLAYLGAIEVEPYQLGEIAQIERRTKHDVAAFLEWVRTGWPRDGAQYLHFGLTSSDVVDTAQGMRFREMRTVFLAEAQGLINEVTGWTRNLTPVLARTHGQPAEPMFMEARAVAWMDNLATAAADLSRNTNRVAVCKLSGPVGTYAHNKPELEATVAKSLGLKPHGAGASQIASRAPLAAWANSAALFVGACAKIAMDLRLMNLLDTAVIPQTAGQVGSSSMAHKNNPIVAEQITGMQHIARGYASMLQPLDGWLERDIAHSSVERIAVPDLWHIVMHTTMQTLDLLRAAYVNTEAAADEIRLAGRAPLISWTTLNNIANDMSWEQAREAALTNAPHAEAQHATQFMRNYPWSGAHR